MSLEPALAARVEEAIAADYRKRPSIPVEETIADPEFVDRFLAAVDALLTAGPSPED